MPCPQCLVSKCLLDDDAGLTVKQGEATWLLAANIRPPVAEKLTEENKAHTSQLNCVNSPRVTEGKVRL